MTEREQLVELVNKLYIYTDLENWEGLMDEVFHEKVFLDMTSLGGEAKDMTAQSICDMWSEGFKDLDSVNHLGGNYLVTLTSSHEAEVCAYATATHYKESATQGNTREFVGTYDFKMTRAEDGWRIHSSTYNLKYMNGNLSLD